MGAPTWPPNPQRSERRGKPVPLLDTPNARRAPAKNCGAPLFTASRQRDVVVLADPLQHEERRRALAGVGDEVWPAGAYGVRFTRPQPHVLLRVAQEDPQLACEHVKGVLDVGVEVPRHLLGGRDLQLIDPEARPLRVPRAAFHVVESARVLDALHIGSPASHSGTGFSFRWWDYCMPPMRDDRRRLRGISP